MVGYNGGVAIVQVKCSYCSAPLRKNDWFKQKTFFCDKRCKGEWQKNQHPVSNEWLRQKYEDEGLDCVKIAAIVGRDPKSVWTWLVNAGIQTRKRGTTGNHKFATPRKGHHISDAHKQKLREARIKSPNLPHLCGGDHHLKGKRGADTPNWKGGSTPERQLFYSSAEWKSCVRAVWGRADAICERCKLDHRTILRGVIPFDLHHVDSFSVVPERRADPNNVMLLCRHCHKWVHSKKNKRKVFLGQGH